MIDKFIEVRFTLPNGDNIATHVTIPMREHQYNNKRSFEEQFISTLTSHLVGYVMSECFEALKYHD